MATNAEQIQQSILVVVIMHWIQFPKHLRYQSISL